MTNTQSTSNEYVEVDLSIDTRRHFPAKNERGHLVFKESEDYETLSKVKVPASIAYDKDLLYEYVSQVMADYEGDICDLCKVNIWDADKEDYRFPY